MLTYNDTCENPLTGNSAEELERRVTERTLELQHEKERLESILDNSFDSLLMVSPDGMIRQTNRGFCETFGIERGEGHAFTSLFENSSAVEAALNEAVATRAIQQLEVTACHENRTGFTAQMILIPFEDTREGVRIICNLRDVTERKQAELRQHALTLGLRKVLTLAYELVSSPDIDTLWKRAVESTRDVLGLERCAIYVAEERVMRGTYGTNLQGETTDEHHNQFVRENNPRSERLESFLAFDETAWEVDYFERSEWDGERMVKLPLGWNVITPIHSPYGFIGVLFSDSAISELPLDPIQQDIVAIFCSFLGSLYEHKRVEADLRRALEREKELGELKSRFTSMISHELRTPLASIQLSSELLRRYPDRLNEEARLRHLDKIEGQVWRLTSLLEDVLTYSKGEQIGLQLRVESLDLHALCEEIAVEVRSADPSHEIIVTAAEGDWNGTVDAKLFRQVLLNLLLNAVKYSEQDTPVNLTLTRDGQDAVISVADQGIGIPEADLPHIFEIFYRAKNVGAKPGTGLGLALVRQIVEGHHGSIACESTVEIGSTFTLRIPCLI